MKTSGKPKQSLLEPWLDSALNFVYPPVCQICEHERSSAAEGYVCAACQEKVRRLTPPFCERCGLPFEGEITGTFDCSNCQDRTLHFRFARSAVIANDLVLEIVHRFKYSGGVWFERFLANALIHEAVPALLAEKWDMIVPIPLHPLKERERQFNQAERLARRLSEAAGLPMNARLVQRVESTATQTMLGRQERAENMRAAFAVRKGQSLSGQKIVLVDDVLTTGATTSSCAMALRKAGAGDVCVWTVARGA